MILRCSKVETDDLVTILRYITKNAIFQITSKFQNKLLGQ